jgi:hypothetical protein
MKINVSRNKGWYSRFRKLKLYVDDEHLYEIKAGESIIIDIPPNAKTIHGNMDWGTTNVLSLENIGEGEQIKIEGYFTLNLSKILGLTEFPMRLKRENEHGDHLFQYDDYREYKNEALKDAIADFNKTKQKKNHETEVVSSSPSPKNTVTQSNTSSKENKYDPSLWVVTPTSNVTNIFCSKCGKYNPRDNKFCKQCGGPLAMDGEKNSRRGNTQTGWNQFWSKVYIFQFLFLALMAWGATEAFWVGILSFFCLAAGSRKAPFDDWIHRGLSFMWGLLWFLMGMEQAWGFLNTLAVAVAMFMLSRIINKAGDRYFDDLQGQA